MAVGTRAELRRRYWLLGTGELAAAAVFAAVAVASTSPRGAGQHAALWSALAPLLVVLTQAGAYWLLARRWVGRQPMPPALASVYRVFRVADAALLLAGLVGVLVWLPPQPGAAVTALAVWLFGVAEYVNYFVVRLAYPARLWLGTVGQLRTPRLVQDLRGSSRPHAGG